jgi:hypothetical protein
MESISKFFKRLGFPLHNTRWSWGAHSDERFVRVLGWKAGATRNASTGLDERIDHLRTLWAGGLAGYTAVATAKDINARPRAIRFYDTENVRAIVSLAAQPDGSIWAELGETVSVKRLAKHAVRHRLIPGDGAFPIARGAERQGPKASNAAYTAQLPAMRAWLIALARNRKTATYSEARAPFGLRTLEHRHAMDCIGHQCLDAGEPILTALIVDEETGRCSSGFFTAFRCDDAEEREDCYAFWASSTAPYPKSLAGKIPGSVTTVDDQPDDSLRARAARFARVSVRPEQATFRRRVFFACGGACAVTGCTIPSVLDAAHRAGRDWKVGHNRGSDGFLLRKDIHALYDAKLVSIDSNGAVTFHPDVAEHYREFVRRA